MTDQASTEQTLWVTDAELIRRMGVPEKIARQTLEMLDKNPKLSGFPQKDALWGKRRYWPAVLAYFERTQTSKMAPQLRRAS